MNAAYRLVWSEQQQAWVPAPEYARARGKRGGLCALAVVSALVAGGAHALPSGGQISAGSGNISQSANTLTVNQQSQNLAVNWQSFNVGSSETVNFLQPGASAIALNRILGSDASQIYGHLNANGQVFLLNPNGILFAPGSQVNVGGLVATTLGMSDADFMAGKFRFSGAAGSVVNEGSIQAADGGYVALLGGQVSNQGVIEAKLGSVDLAAGGDITLGIAGNSLLSLQVNQGTLKALAENRQLIVAEGGRVLLTAQAANQLASAVVNNTGVIEAQTLSNQNGHILLLADAGVGQVNVGGTLDASAPNGGNGGQIETSGAHVNIAGAKITAAAPQGKAGTWLVDPTDLTIDTTAATTINNTLNGGTDVSEQTTATTASGVGNQASGNGDINVDAPLSWSTSNTLALSAYNNININAPVSVTGSGNLTLQTNNQQGGTNTAGSLNVATGGNVQFSGATPGALTINGSAYTLIQNMSQLQAMGATGNYALAENLDGTGVSGFLPIGIMSNATFSGVFNGLGNSIANLNINLQFPGNAGLFTSTSGAISNLTLSNFTVSGPSNMGVLAGSNSGSISNVSVSGTVGSPLDQGEAGGLVGQNTGTINNTQAAVAVTISGSGGGLVGGEQGGSISNSTASGNVTGNGHIGGLVGDDMSGGGISYSTASGSVTGNGNVGGLIGYVLYGNSPISNVSASGNVNGGSGNNVGGLIGYVFGSGLISNAHATGTVQGGSQVGGLIGYNYAPLSNVYATGAVTSNQSGATDVGGLVGLNSGSISNAYASGSLSTASGATYVGGITGSNSAAFNNVHFDVDQVTINGTHQLGLGGLYDAQYQDWFTHGETLNIANYSATLPFNSGNGTYVISSVQGLKDMLGFEDTAGLKFALGANIDLSSVPGFYIPTFSGALFDGSGYSISNLQLTSGGQDYQGLFGNISGGGTIQNLTLNNAQVNGINDVGGLVGNDNGVALNNISVVGSVSGSSYVGLLAGNTNSSVTAASSSGTVSGSGGGAIGGLVGDGQGGSISNSWSSANVTGTGSSAQDIGGLAGAGGSISNSYATGAVNASSGSEEVGGLAGDTNGAVTNAYATGAVSGGTYVGGLIGFSWGTVTDTYSMGAVHGSTWTGGLVGASEGTVSNSYWDTTTSGMTSSDGGSALSDAQMRQQSSFAGFSFGGSNPVWRIYQGDTAPLLESFLTPLTITANNVTKVYDGTYTGLTNVSYSLPSAAGSPNLFGIATPYGTGSKNNVGSYSANLWSNQQGYDITLVGGQLTVTPLAVTVSAAGNNKVYNGNTADSVSLAANGVLSGDNIAFAGAGAFANKNVGNNLGVSVNITATGSDAQNYSFNTTAQTTASITPAPITVTSVAAVNRSYDSTTNGNYSSTVTGVVSGDYVYAASAFQDKNVGNNKTLDITGLVGSGAQNYYLTNPTVTGTGTITPTTLTLSNLSAASKVYDTTTTASATASLSGVLGLDNVTDSLSASFANKNVGTGKTVTVNSVTLSGTDAGNYTIATGETTTATITPATLTLTNVSASNKVYDSTTTAAATASLSGVLGTDSVSNSLSASFADKNVGNGKTVTVNGVSLSGTDAGNYTVASGETTTATITPATLTLSNLAAANKVYDTTTTASATASLSGVLGTDNVTDSLSASFADKNVGTGKNVTVNATLSGTDAGNYVMVGAETTTANITPATLTLSNLAAANKVYDTTTTASATASLSGVLGTDNVTGSLSASFADKNVGTGKTVTVNGIALSGGDAGNYVIASGETTTANITPATLSAGLTGSASKVYDGTTSATLGAGNYTLSGVLGSDAVSLNNPTTGSYAGKDVGNGLGVSVSGLGLTGTDAGNYVLASNSASANIGIITPKALTLSGLSAGNKVYDATTTALATGSLSGVVSGDTVNDTLAATFADKNVGTGKTVTVNGITLSGAQAGDYTIAAGETTTANITPATLTASLSGTVGKVYDATTTATLAAGNYAVSGVLGSDAVSLNNPTTGSYASKSAGTGIGVSVSGLGLSGTDAGNYVLASSSVSGNVGTITPKALTLSGLSASNKVYDATTMATATGSLSGVLSGDTVTDTLAATFADKNVGTGKTVTVNGITLGGAQASDYTIATGETTTANITPKSLTISSISGNSKVYDATRNATGTGVLSGVISGDAVNLALAGTFLSKNVSSSDKITISGQSLTGTDAGNYSLSSNEVGKTTYGSITPAPLFITANNDTVTYSGSPFSGGNGVTYSGFVGGETSSVLSGTLSYGGSSQGATAVGSYVISASGLRDSNYSITWVNGTLNINP